MTTRRDTSVWFVLTAAALGAALAWAQLLAAVGFGVLDFDRRFDAGADNDWLDNYRNVLWFCATAVIVAVLLARSAFRDPSSRPRWIVAVTAASGAGTVVPYLMEQAGSAKHLSLVDQASVSAAQAAIVGLALGAVTSLIVGVRAASARVLAWGAVMGAVVLWILMLVSANAKAYGPSVLGVLEFDALAYDTRVDVMLASASTVGVVTAALVSVVARRETTATLIVAGLLTVGSVAATLLVTAVVGPSPSGDHADLGANVIVPLLLGGVPAFGLLAMVARHRRRSLPPAHTVTSPAGSVW
ncbi:hypothetical protein [Catellatospora sichuanensis]|uniref:hypothetical protein n=1 Tax=Catellatospora sichuanensis TaxID=1969805 RepID=UPI001181F08E|nr:hypothetical protein [Catellatospora sichuanensis]